MVTKIIKTYLAGPMAHVSENEMHGWRERIKRYSSEFGRTFEWRDPTRRLYRDGNMDFQTAWEIVTNDKVDINYCDFLIADFRELANKIIMTGTTQECIYAFERGKHVISIVSPKISLSPWIWCHSHQVVNTEDQAVDGLLHEADGGYINQKVLA